MRLLLFAIVAAAGAAALPALSGRVHAADMPELSVALDRSTRLLVIAPHPDDEVIGAAGLIQRVLTRGGATNAPPAGYRRRPAHP
ncbi:MAG TPA: hypothetical protein VM032_19765 [Vicinamibacterales bacterium]|nr:hypothetical protein [Vicinamibacterales bacterium]